MEKTCILVVDDEESLCEILKFNLEKAGYAVDTALSAEEALTMNLTAYHLMILDVMMGEISGFQMANILKKKKETTRIPIIFCTARDTEDDTVYGLQLGADDYVSKPFSIREVLARVEAVLRRNTRSVSEPPSENIRQYENLRLDTTSKRASLGGRDVSLTKTEFEILWLLLQSPGRVYSRDSLLRTVWPDDVLVADRTVDVHIARMRKKIVPYDKHIVTRLGYGYCFEG